MKEGDMVRRGAGQPMRVVNLFEGMTRCIFVDSHGNLQQRFYYEFDLTPLWVTLQPKSLWPDPGNLPELEEKKEERFSAIAKALGRRPSKKPRASNKIQRIKKGDSIVGMKRRVKLASSETNLVPLA